MLYQSDLNQLLKKFVSDEISLNQPDISSAIKTREWLLEKIKTKLEEINGEPILYTPDRFVRFGSYFAGTKVKVVDELDFLVVIDSNSGVFSIKDNEYGKGLGTANPNHKYDQRFKKSDDSGVSPTKMLNWLKGILTEVVEPFGGEVPEKDGQAITVLIKSKGIKFDFIPAGVFERSDGSSHIFYNIPKADKSNGWTVTNPKKDIERVTTLARDRSDFRNVIRLIKYIRDQYNMGISSYTIQCSVCGYAETNSWSNSFFEDFLLALKSFELNLSNGFISDGFDSSVNLLEGVNSNEYYAERLKSLISNLYNLTHENDKGTALSKMASLLSNGKIQKSFDSRTLATMTFPGLASTILGLRN